MTAARVPAFGCTNCGKVTNMAAPVPGTDDVAPEPGDITICIYCSHLMAFTDDMTMRDLSGDEIVAIAGDADVLRGVEAVRMMREMLGDDIHLHEPDLERLDHQH